MEVVRCKEVSGSLCLLVLHLIKSALFCSVESHSECSTYWIGTRVVREKSFFVVIDITDMFAEDAVCMQVCGEAAATGAARIAAGGARAVAVPDEAAREPCGSN